MATKQVSSTESPLPSVDQRQWPSIVGQRRSTHVFVDAPPPSSCHDDDDKRRDLAELNGTSVPKKNGDENESKRDDEPRSIASRTAVMSSNPGFTGAKVESVRSTGDESHGVACLSTAAATAAAAGDGDDTRTYASGTILKDRGQAAATGPTDVTEQTKTATVGTCFGVTANLSTTGTDGHGSESPSLVRVESGERTSRPDSEQVRAPEQEIVGSAARAGRQLADGPRRDIATTGESTTSKTDQSRSTTVIGIDTRQTSLVGDVARQTAATDIAGSFRVESASAVDVVVDRGGDPEQEDMGEAEAMKRLSKLRAVTKQLREAVDEAKAINDEVNESSVKVEKLKTSVGHQSKHDDEQVI